MSRDLKDTGIEIMVQWLDKLVDKLIFDMF